MLLSLSGLRLDWLVSPPTPSETFEGPWHVYEIAAGMSAQGPRTWIAYSHHTWWPAFVLEVAPNAASHLKYVQPGRIYSLTYWRTPTDTWLVAGGTLNEESNASAALVNVNRPPARWQVDSGLALECSTCPEAPPGAMFLLPTSDVTRALSRPYGWVVGGRGRACRSPVATRRRLRTGKPCHAVRGAARDKPGSIRSLLAGTR